MSDHFPPTHPPTPTHTPAHPLTRIPLAYLLNDDCELLHNCTACRRMCKGRAQQQGTEAMQGMKAGVSVRGRG